MNDTELLQLDAQAGSIELKARNMRTYLALHPNELMETIKAFYDQIAQLRLENAKLKETLLRREAIKDEI